MVYFFLFYNNSHTLEEYSQLRKTGLKLGHYDDVVSLIPFLLIVIISLDSFDFFLLRRCYLLVEGIDPANFLTAVETFSEETVKVSFGS
jgi:hypothetical protein